MCWDLLHVRTHKCTSVQATDYGRRLCELFRVFVGTVVAQRHPETRHFVSMQAGFLVQPRDEIDLSCVCVERERAVRTVPSYGWEGEQGQVHVVSADRAHKTCGTTPARDRVQLSSCFQSLFLLYVQLCTSFSNQYALHTIRRLAAMHFLGFRKVIFFVFPEVLFLLLSKKFWISYV
jgi:hypothetical protein